MEARIPTSHRFSVPSGHHVTISQSFKKVEATQSNSQILSQVLNEQLRMARKARYPSAEDIVEELI